MQVSDIVVNDSFADLTTNLNSIYRLAKALHWNATKYDEHLLYDRIGDGIDGFIDDIVEVCIVPWTGNGNIIPETKIDSITPGALLDAITRTLALMEGIEARESLPQGVKNLLGTIAQDLIVKRMLLNQNIIKAENL